MRALTALARRGWIRNYRLFGHRVQKTASLPWIAMAEGRLTVAVLGAAGTIAPAIVHDLAQSDEVAQMALLDLDRDKAAAVAQAHGAGKATAAAIDARDVDGLAAVLAGAEVLINTASYRINLEAMRACLRA